VLGVSYRLGDAERFHPIPWEKAGTDSKMQNSKFESENSTVQDF